MRRPDRRIAIRFAQFDFGQCRCQRTTLRQRNLHIIIVQLKMRLHALHKALVTQKHLTLEIIPRRLGLTPAFLTPAFQTQPSVYQS